MCERAHCNMVTQSQASSQRSRYAWTEEREQAFINCLLDAVKQGKRTDTGWKPIVASEAVDIFRSKGFPAVTKSQLDSKRDAVYDP
jgi:Myb/SANT-like DNA-binding domain